MKYVSKRLAAPIGESYDTQVLKDFSMTIKAKTHVEVLRTMFNAGFLQYLITSPDGVDRWYSADDFYEAKG